MDKLAPVPADLSKLSNVVKNDVDKKAVYDKLAAKVKNIDTSAFVLKTKYLTDKTELEKIIPNLSDFVKKTKVTELENEIPHISSLATKTALRWKIKYLVLVVNSKKQTMTQKLVSFKRNLLIIIMINILQRLSFIFSR